MSFQSGRSAGPRGALAEMTNLRMFAAGHVSWPGSIARVTGAPLECVGRNSGVPALPVCWAKSKNGRDTQLVNPADGSHLLGALKDSLE